MAMKITIRPGGSAFCPICQEAISKRAMNHPQCHSDLASNEAWIAAQNKGGCAPLLIFACLLIVACLGGCTRTARDSSATVAEMPIFVVRQYPDYPPPGQASMFPGGLVTALWKDGRILRPATKIGGDTYQMGVISAEDARKLMLDIENLREEDAHDDNAIPLHGASQSIAIQRNGLRNAFHRTLPDKRGSLQDVQNRLMAIAIAAPQSIHFDTIRRMHWYKDL